VHHVGFTILITVHNCIFRTISEFFNLKKRNKINLPHISVVQEFYILIFPLMNVITYLSMFSDNLLSYIWGISLPNERLVAAFDDRVTARWSKRPARRRPGAHHDKYQVPTTSRKLCDTRHDQQSIPRVQSHSDAGLQRPVENWGTVTQLSSSLNRISYEHPLLTNVWILVSD
jgi:hypothetical protein